MFLFYSTNWINVYQMSKLRIMCHFIRENKIKSSSSTKKNEIVLHYMACVPWLTVMRMARLFFRLYAWNSVAPLNIMYNPNCYAKWKPLRREQKLRFWWLHYATAPARCMAIILKFKSPLDAVRFVWPIRLSLLGGPATTISPPRGTTSVFSVKNASRCFPSANLGHPLREI